MCSCRRTVPFFLHSSLNPVPAGQLAQGRAAPLAMLFTVNGTEPQCTPSCSLRPGMKQQKHPKREEAPPWERSSHRGTLTEMSPTTRPELQHYPGTVTKPAAEMMLVMRMMGTVAKARMFSGFPLSSPTTREACGMSLEQKVGHESQIQALEGSWCLLGRAEQPYWQQQTAGGDADSPARPHGPIPPCHQHPATLTPNPFGVQQTENHPAARSHPTGAPSQPWCQARPKKPTG